MRILVIRGGALGDFVLTLPAVALLREKWPQARIECLGYPGIATLGLNRFYFDAVRAMDHRGLAGFFIPDLILDPDFMDYFGSFDLVLSYIFDPDQLFRRNLQRCGLTATGSIPETRGLLVCVDPRVRNVPAVEQLARPLIRAGLAGDIRPPRLYLSEGDKAYAEERWGGFAGKLISIHPGSGSSSKNWPVENWIQLAGQILKKPDWKLLITAGEADAETMARLRKSLPADVRIESGLNLNQLAALYSKISVFAGNDSGPGHVAAAVGARCVLLYGPTDPDIWAPRSESVRALSSGGDWSGLSVDAVWNEIVRQADKSP